MKKKLMSLCFLFAVLFAAESMASDFFLVKDQKPCAVIVKPAGMDKSWENTVQFFQPRAQHQEYVKTAFQKAGFSRSALNFLTVFH